MSTHLVPGMSRGRTSAPLAVGDRRLLLGRGGDRRSALPLLVGGDPYWSSPGRGCPTAGTPWQHQILLRGLDVLLHIEIVLDGGGRCTPVGPRKPALDPELTPRLLAAPSPILGGCRRRYRCRQSSPQRKEGDAEMGGDGEEGDAETGEYYLCLCK
jgi:hypothetical protein